MRWIKLNTLNHINNHLFTAYKSNIKNEEMIYLERDLRRKLAKGFFYFSEFNYQAAIILRQRRKRKLKKPSFVESIKCVRTTPQFRERDFNYWSTPWGILVKKFGNLNHGAGPCIDSRDGKLFRRRFRVPWKVYCDLVTKCREKLVFGPNSCDDFTITGNTVCPIEIKLLGVLHFWHFKRQISLFEKWYPNSRSKAYR